MSKKNSKETVSKYLENLALGGQYYFTNKEVIDELSIKESSLSVSLSRLSKNGKVKMIRNGFGIFTGFTQGVLHPSYFVDAMMKHLNARYYVALLSAAAHWGASHQASMTYCIVADKTIKPISLGQIKIVFIVKKNFDQIKGIKRVAGIGGYYLISSSELTVVDLIRFPKKSGHLNNVATLLEELFEDVNEKKLISICSEQIVPTVTLQRLGYILDKVLDLKKEAGGVEYILNKRCFARSVLSVSRNKNRINLTDFPFDKRWKLYINTSVEPD